MAEATQRLYKYIISTEEKTGDKPTERVYEESDFLTLREIDEKFTQYEGEEDYKEVEEIEKGISFGKKKIKIRILYYYNKEHGKFQELPVLFERDANVLDIERTAADFDRNKFDIPVVLGFVNQLATERNAGLKQKLGEIMEYVNKNQAGIERDALVVLKDPEQYEDRNSFNVIYNQRRGYVTVIDELSQMLGKGYGVNRIKYLAVRDSDKIIVPEDIRTKGA